MGITSLVREYEVGVYRLLRVMDQDGVDCAIEIDILIYRIFHLYLSHLIILDLLTRMYELEALLSLILINRQV